MAADGTGIKNDIDNNLANKGYRGIRITSVITALKNTVDWVTSAINSNLSTWLKASDGTPSGAVADVIYHTGKVIVGRTTDDGSGAIMQVQGVTSLMGTQFRGAAIPSAGAGVEVQYGAVPNSGSIYVYDRTAGAYKPLLIDGSYILLNSGTGGYVGINVAIPLERLHVLGNALLDGMLRFPDVVASRKIALYGGNTNDNQFFGFGVDSNVLRYQVGGPTAGHVFYSGVSPATSLELMRIQGDGKVGIGKTVLTYGFNVSLNNPQDGGLLLIENARSTAGRTGTKIILSTTGIAAWRMGLSGDLDAFVIEGWGGGAYPERLRIDTNGNVGINISVPTVKLDVQDNNPASGIIARLINPRATAGRTGVRQSFHQEGVAIWRIGQPADTDAFIIEGYQGGAYPEYLRIDTLGNMGLGVSAPTSKLHLKASAGHYQFRLETPYTPTSSADANGAVGQVAWDATYFYIKTAAGWRRTPWGAAW